METVQEMVTEMVCEWVGGGRVSVTLWVLLTETESLWEGECVWLGEAEEDLVI